ncbi:sigma 54-interacting transcriptional regulator [Desulfobotulus sp.]|jgi:PAS domain S-box-containing protein|uniref:sigma 54-interacting transcriptional regulator n=1 Tax=Desulfobotulus sp. TaxID=1940337 RepID=UPI002A35DCB1|nr:sigma 54-interacting transcriptional regulator [Desulfobotulus sp.]MDY0164460.1 sigma 54-interacting transcriptional regulator [Desulfobotulus sp.]
MLSSETSACAFTRNFPDERLIFENTTDAIIVLQDGFLRYVNANGVRLMGYTHEELVNHHFREFVHPEDLPMVTLRYKQRMNYEPVPEVYPFRLITKGGEPIWFEIHAVEITWKGERASLTFFHNIQRRMLAEKALAHNEARTRAILNAIPDMLLRLTLDGLCLKHKPFEDHHCHTAFISVEGNNIRDFYPEPIAVLCMQAMNRAFSTREMQIFEFPYDCQTGRIHYEARAVALEQDEILLIVRDISDRKRMEESLRQREENLRKENIRLRSSIRDRYGFRNLIGKSPAMQAVYDSILKAAASNAHVIIYGESGTGKELVARAIHDLSERARAPFVPVNCGAIPEGLMESEFFGYKKGAFSGAVSDRKGYMDLACHGTLFMDELGEIDVNMQVKLLRAIEGGGFMPVGGDCLHKPDLRIIGATNRNLMDLVRKRMMREDFFYRINIIPIHLPPLRDRGEDLNLLIYHFLESLCQGGRAPVLPANIMTMLQAYSWPGNVRELQNVIQRYLTMDSIDLGGKMEAGNPESLPLSSSEGEEELMDLKQAVEGFERIYIEKALKIHRWKKEETAKALGVHRKTLFRKMRDLGLE